jgi:cytochrome c5
LRITGLAALPLLLLAACNDKPNNADIAAAEAKQSRDAANDGRIDCALEGAKLFDRTCTVQEMSGAEGAVLVVGRSDVGYRRLQITTDGRGVISADGAEVANVSIVDEGVIEVAIGNDRYRLPADTGGVD